MWNINLISFASGIPNPTFFGNEWYSVLQDLFSFIPICALTWFFESQKFAMKLDIPACPNDFVQEDAPENSLTAATTTGSSFQGLRATWLKYTPELWELPPLPL